MYGYVGSVFARMFSQAAGPSDDDEAMTSVLQFTSPTATTDDTPPAIVWSGWSHGAGQFAGVEMLYGIGCVAWLAPTFPAELAWITPAASSTSAWRRNPA